jgi:hypothetical protein
MLWWSIQIAIISFILIFLVHHLFHFFKSTLTVPKVKDLVNGNKEDYDNINRILDTSLESSAEEEDIYLPTNFLPSATDQETMKNELKHFLKSQFNGQQQSANQIDAIEDTFHSSTSLSSLPI